ncbi:MAG: hypothetical protein Q8S73_11910 [Deltaproteobacteria bacterium]|nr:hypothetical protein [Myxococcales bacterium]MDP3214803.1 hypothetical protein [Deltaproteobacteria bacterium]
MFAGFGRVVIFSGRANASTSVLGSWLLNRSSAATALRDELRSRLAVPEDEPLGAGDLPPRKRWAS